MKIQYLLLVAASLLHPGCKDDDDADAIPKGTITGELRLADEFGNEFTDHSGMSISLDQGATTISEASGSYSITGLASGDYDMTYEKEGYGTFMKFSIQVLGGADSTILNGIDYLGQKSTTVVSNLTIIPNISLNTFNINCNISPTPSASQPRPFRLFFGKSDDVSNDNYDFAPSNTWLATGSSGSILNYDPADLYSNGFSSGETVYVIAYGESMYSNSWTDPVSGKKFYPNVNTGSPSNVADFVLP